MSSSAPGPQKLSHTHRDIARWLLENPGEYHSVGARHFGVTPAYFSTLINCDMMQALLKELQAGADEAVIMDIPSKLRGVASLALDGLQEAVADACADNSKLLHRGFLKDTAEMTLELLGYSGAKPAGAVPAGTFNQQNNVHIYGPVSPDVLAGAQKRLLTLPVEARPELPEASKLPSSVEGDASELQR